MTQQYYLLPIIILLLILYLSSIILYSDKKIIPSIHKLIWDLVLTASALVVVITGMVMIILIIFGVLPLDMNLLFWHVEAGIVTVITAIFHIHIHWRAFKRTFRSSFAL